ncbi:S1C family serine protease [Myceligenerans crystallogenes]|uniref:Trypsin-like peptidase domain-containing protein n=1 Tax=Myceligenerans crystallogenes TaxID=316335 RepID=A0ABP4ZCP3_9MICO
MNSQQNPTGQQGQDPEAAHPAPPPPPAEPAPADPGTPTPAAEARAAQVGTGATPAPAARPAEQAPPAQTSYPTRPLPAQHGAPEFPPAPRGAEPAPEYPPASHRTEPAPGTQPAPPAPPAAYAGNPYAAPGAAGTAPKPRRDSRWGPVVGAAAIAALLASAGTAGAISLFDGDSRAASLAEVGEARQQNAVPVSSSGDAPDWQAVTAAVQDSVVSIQVATQSGGGEGSGVVIDADGHILTNNHVVAGAEQVQVALSDGRLLEAEVVGTDATTDLAVVRLQDVPDDLKAATIGDSDAVTTGDPVMAIGNPLGLDGTATTGIISALNRPVTASAEDGSAVSVTNAIQTDAAVNPGNSGGPLFTANGEVIGINSSILTLSGGMGGQSGSIGLGFAIPSNLATDVGRQLIDDGTAEHAFLGVSLSDATATADGVTRRGARIEDVVAGSPAQEAGLEVGDVVVAIGEDAVDGPESLTAFVREYGAGDETTVTVVGDDGDGETRQVDVTLAVLDEEQTSGQGQQEPQLPGQDDMSGQEGQEGSGSDQTDPGNIPDWLRELFGN